MINTSLFPDYWTFLILKIRSTFKKANKLSKNPLLAITILMVSLGLFPAEAWSQNLVDSTTVKKHLIKADSLRETSKFQEAITHYQSALKVLKSANPSDTLKEADIYSDIGECYYLLWNHEDSKKYFEMALNLYQDKYPDNIAAISSCYSYFARIYTRSEEHSKALVYNKKTLVLNRRTFGEESSQVGLAYAIMAITYGRLTDFETSLSYFEKANDRFISEFGKKHKWVITTYENIGRAYNRLGNFNESLKNYEEAIRIGKDYLGEDDLTVAHVYLNAADTYAALNQNQIALELYQKARAVQIKAYGENHREVAQNYIAEGNFHAAIGEYSKALDCFDAVLVKMYGREIADALSSDYVSYEFNLFYKLIEAMEGKARALVFQYKENGDLNRLILANELYQNSETILDKMRKSVSSFEDRQSLTAANQVAPKGIIETSYLLFEEFGEEDYLEKAFHYSEKNRAGVLREVVLINTLQNPTKKFKELLEFERELKKDKSILLSKYNQDIVEQTLKDSIEGKLFKNKLVYDSLLLEMRENYPNYFEVQHSNHMNGLSKVQSNLKENTSILEYFIADSTTTYGFLISKSKFLVKRLDIKKLDDKVTIFRNSIKEKNLKSFKKSSYELYLDLIGPFSKDLEGDELIIVPDGVIWYLNFDLLLTSKTGSNNPKELPYILRDYAVSYTNSANFFLNDFKNDIKNKKNYIGFSYLNSQSTKITDIEDLPGTRKEVEIISSKLDGDAYHGSLAEEASFKAKAGDYDIIHLALHGVVDNDRPENSKLYFTKGKDTIDDNVLYSHEIFTMRLPASLAILSACNTGSGKVTAGEGIMSLGYAFQYAGVKSLLISGWEVSDDTSPELISLFYDNMNSGMNKSRALQQAKLSFLENVDSFRSSPFYWGGYYLVGDTSAIILDKERNWLPYLFVFIIVPLFIWYRKRQ